MAQKQLIFSVPVPRKKPLEIKFMVHEAFNGFAPDRYIGEKKPSIHSDEVGMWPETTNTEKNGTGQQN